MEKHDIVLDSINIYSRVLYYTDVKLLVIVTKAVVQQLNAMLSIGITYVCILYILLSTYIIHCVG